LETKHHPNGTASTSPFTTSTLSACLEHLATNLIQFYAFFEIMLVPSFFLIAEWGYGDKERISLMYFIWTHVGALVLLVGILLTGYLTGGVTDMALINPSPIPSTLRLIIVAAMCFGFFVKMAQFGVHIWCRTHTPRLQPPSVPSYLPAMIGIGGYAIVRIVMTIFPEAFLTLSAFFAALAVVTMFYGAAMALVQDDIKRLLAYSSVSQMGYILFGLALQTVSESLAPCSSTSVMGPPRESCSWLRGQ